MILIFEILEPLRKSDRQKIMELLANNYEYKILFDTIRDNSPIIDFKKIF